MTPKPDNTRATRTRRRGALWRKQSPVVRVSMRTASATAFMYWDNIVGLDLDNCCNPATGKIDRGLVKSSVRRILIPKLRPAVRVSAYSSMGSGGPRASNRRTGVCWERQRRNLSEWFFAITGDDLRGTPRKIERCSDVISQLDTRFFPPSRPSGSSTTRTAAAVTNDDAALIEKARNAKMATNFNDYGKGDWEGDYESQSEADIALCGLLAFWTDCDSERMDNVFRRSCLFRPKWMRAFR